MDSILISKYIYNTLTTNTQLAALVGNRIFPIVAENDTPQPFIVFSRTGINPVATNKDGYIEDSVSFSVTVVADSYATSLEIASAVRKCFTKLKDTYTGIELYDMHLTGITESYNNGEYLQQMNFVTNVC